jgi:kynureninase
MAAADLPRAHAEELDLRDALAEYRNRFVVADPDLIYLDGNSLGPLTADTEEFLANVLRLGWGQGLVRSWDTWIDWGRQLGDRLAEHVLGARAGEVVMADSTSVNLYKLAAAALDALPDRRTVVVDSEDFPTNRYIVQGLAKARRLTVHTLQSDMDRGLDLDVLRDALNSDVGLVVLSLVTYRCGAMLDMAAVNDMARAAGAFVLWDLSHAAGAVPIDLHSTGATLAVGCTYKYLNGGPGAPSFLYVRKEAQAALRQPIWGWFGQRGQFDMGPEYDPVEAIERFLVGTPPILSLAPFEPALALIEQAGMERVRRKGIALGELIIDLADRWLAPYGFRVASPRSAHRRGSHVSLAHPDAWRICRALADAGVICDFRRPNRLRLGASPLFNRFTDIWDGMDRLRGLLAGRDYELQSREPARVT